jgi:hypothetical protein
VILGRFHEGGIEVQDEIGQVLCDTSPLQDITNPEITEEYEGGIEGQDEIGQVSRDTSSLQNITSPEITKAHEGLMMMCHVIPGRFHLVPQFPLHVL